MEIVGLEFYQTNCVDINTFCCLSFRQGTLFANFNAVSDLDARAVTMHPYVEINKWIKIK